MLSQDIARQQEEEARRVAAEASAAMVKADEDAR